MGVVPFQKLLKRLLPMIYYIRSFRRSPMESWRVQTIRLNGSKDVGLAIEMMSVSFYDFAWKPAVNFVIPDFWC